MAKISVILPFYNAEAFLENSVQSILQQSFSDFELLLINNNSTDGSLALAKRFTEKDPRVKLLYENRQGVVFASETGLKYASANIIARADADDIWYKDKLRLQYDFLLENETVDVVSCLVNFKGPEANAGMKQYVDDSNKFITHDQISYNRFSELQVINPTIMFRKHAAEKFGFYKEGNFPEDYEMFLRWLEKGIKFYKIPQKLLDWTDHEKRLTRTDSRYSTDAFYEIKSEYLFRFLQSVNPFHPKVFIWGAGKLSQRRLKFLTSLGIEPECFIDVDKKKTLHSNVISYLDIPEAGTCFIVSYVNNRGMRNEIRKYLQSENYVEGVHFILA